ncbi:Spy/CpxP family protein refolding chaperone [Natronospira proteinivora]|uniref:Spy/CpxP family protein refolding chaperone n=1 Tax=Natronospira proteinivora TaxID=1807133 RepID=A0ABT1G664_9GAMM|nr:hypothetical protein [Natronospira proteinivora]MCP1726582.1 Spy/CpxP family protein refolding chaperone [Natronospira proteinivora]
MKRTVWVASVLVLILPGMGVWAFEEEGHTGQQAREIKALSESDIDGLLAGEGLGYAITAELHGYPGPAHVLELADELDLSDDQRADTQAIFDQMLASAKTLGAQLVEAEQTLDKHFSEKTIDEALLKELTAKIADIESRLRAVHLNAHLQQTELMSRRQIHQYMILRGHSGDGHESGHHHD